MADTKISALTAKAAPVAADTLVIVDSDGGANKKTTVGDLPVAKSASGFATFAGPTQARTYTLPDAAKTLLATDGSAANLTNFPTLNQDTTGVAAGLVLNPNIADHGHSGIVFTGTAGENLVLGDVCYLKSDGKYWLAKADVANTKMPGVVMATAGIAANATGVFLQKGFIRDDSWSAWTVGGALFVSITGTTGNTVTQTAPAATGNIVQDIGYAYAAKVLFFDPNRTQVEVP